MKSQESALAEESAEEQKCVVCDEGISNPVCPECLEKQMQAFFGEKTGMQNNFIKKLAKISLAENTRSSWCVCCGKQMAVCTHCFSSEVFDMVKEDYPDLKQDFLLHFNYYLSS